MSEASSRLKELVAAERALPSASAEARRRNRVRLARQLGAGAAVGASAVTSSTWGAWIASAPAKFLATVAVAAAGSGSAAWLASGAFSDEPAGAPTPTASAAPAAKVAAGSRLEAPAVVALPIEAPPLPSVETASAPSRAPSEPDAVTPEIASSPTDDSLSAQTRVLATMRAAMRSGQPEKALAELDRAGALAQRGPLTEELLATRVFALCQLGQHDQARQAAAAFAGRFPASALLGRVQGACANAR